MKIKNLKLWLISLCCVAMAGFTLWRLANLVFASPRPVSGEQVGGSPQSNSNSKIKMVYDSLSEDLGYGSDSAGDWGDWGAYWNRIRSASEWAPPSGLSADEVKDGAIFYSGSRDAQTGTASMISLANMYNGTGTGDLDDFTQDLGGVDDYNGGNSMPPDSYSATWTACNEANQYCGTDSTVAEARDENSGLVWSPMIYAGDGSYDWFWANNCQTNNGLGGDGVCSNQLDVDCICVKNTGEDLTGCEDYDDGGWRKKKKKELLLAYIDGAAGGLTEPSRFYWSATTYSDYTGGGWGVYLSGGVATGGSKPSTKYSVRCVR